MITFTTTSPYFRSNSSISPKPQGELADTVTTDVMALPTTLHSTKITSAEYHPSPIPASNFRQEQIATDFYLKTVHNWSKKGEPGENRTAAMMHIKAWLADKPRQHHGILKLNNLALTTLPPYPMSCDYWMLLIIS